MIFGKPGFKSKEPEEFERPEKSKIPMPPPITDRLLLDSIKKDLEELKQGLMKHHEIVMAMLEPKPEAIVLDEEELKLVPEEDKDMYLELKKTSPKMAAKTLKGYKSGSK